MIPASTLALLPAFCAGAMFLLPQGWAARRVVLFDASARIVVLLACLAMFLVEEEPAWPDSLSLLTACLVAVQSVLVGLSHMRRGSRSRLAGCRDHGVLAGLLLVALATEPLLVWLALVLTAAVARVSERPGMLDVGMPATGTADMGDPDGNITAGGANSPPPLGGGGWGEGSHAASLLFSPSPQPPPARGEGEFAGRSQTSVHVGRLGRTAASIGSGRDGLVAGAGCLILFGLIALPSAPTLLALGCLLLGQAMLVVMVPALLPLVLVLVPRFRGIASLTHDAALTDAMLMALGLATALACGSALLMRPRWLIRSLGLVRFGGQDRLAFLHIAQTGIGVFAFGLGTAEALFAGLITLLLVTVTWTAVEISTAGKAERLVAVAGMAGLPPFGVWPGLVLVVLATAHRSVWLLLALSLALGLIAWATVARLPAGRWTRSAVPALAWVPLAATVLLGLAIPDIATAWLRNLTVVPG